MNRRLLLLSLVALALLGAARMAVTAPARTLTVYAASSLTDAFNALAPEFERSQPGVKVRLNFGASSTLRAQIEQGAPADIFASADMANVQPLLDAKKVAQPQVFARTRLVLVVPGTNPGRIRSPRDLDHRGLRFVTTGETVPIGRYTEQVLEKLSKQPAFGAEWLKRVQGNVVSREANVRSLLAKVELGEADAAVVYETDARSVRRVRVIQLPDAANVTAEYPITAVAGSPNAKDAEAFVRFVTGGRGQATLRSFGFR